MSFRLQNRSKKEFSQHIEKCTIMEKALMELYVDWLNAKNKGVYTYKDNGCGNDGEFIEDEKRVTTQADFVLLKDGKRPRKIEIKHCGPERSRFHIKARHIERCIREDYCIVNWMGVNGDNPRFCILTPKMLQEKINTNKPINFWNQPCYRWNNTEVEWINVK